MHIALADLSVGTIGSGVAMYLFLKALFLELCRGVCSECVSTRCKWEIVIECNMYVLFQGILRTRTAALSLCLEASTHRLTA